MENIYLPITEQEFKKLYLNTPNSELEKLWGISRYYITNYAKQLGLNKKKGRPVEKVTNES